ncbi:MAG TPA: hypothetical protein VLH10_25575, partial [Yinghuangia sp.]|nr:hypothetical protein [Yinghuangia sp.]
MSRDIASDIGCHQETDTYTDEDAVSAPLVRNRFHPGKLMDVRHWYLEQDYHRRTAALSARLGLGPGVLCGLDVELCDDESLVVGPGVALDGRGRLIIVERPVRIDRPEVPTDCLGRPDGEPVHDGTVAVRLCHHECGTEYVRTSSADCDPHEDCVPSLTAERFMLRITEGEPKFVGLSEEQCAAVFPVDKPEDFDRRRAIARHIDHDCGCGHDDGCVVLATLRFSSERDTRLNAVRSRPVVYSNRVLFELLLCLAARVDACCDALPSPAAPRIAGIWPPPISRGQGTERQRVLTEEHRLEITFDRDLREPALDSPDAWLGVWQLDAAGARRVRLERVGGELRHLVPPPGGEGVVYRVVFDEPLPESAGVAILARVEPTGEPRAAGGDRLSL